MNTKTLTLSQAVKDAVTSLDASSASSRLESEILLCHVLGKSREYCYTWPETPINKDAYIAFTALLNKRQCGQPIAYLTGEKEFWSRPFKVTKHTLIPRPETERLIEVVLNLFSQDAAMNILDLGTGSGNIAITLAKHYNNANLFATDKSKAALAVAQKNARRLGAKVSFIESDWFFSVPKKSFELIVSNPPYIDEKDPHLDQGDVRFEPKSALIAKNNGIAAIDKILHEARQYLKPQGIILLEHGFNQGQSVRTLMSTYGYTNINTYKDLASHERCTLGVK